jgi:arylsulfatase A-like enzyme
MELLEEMGGGPFFLFLHYWDVHYDYAPPAPYDEIFDPDYSGDVTADNFIRNEAIRSDMEPGDLEHVVALYDGEIAYTDHYLGRLFDELKKLDLWDKTMIVVTSDHGDEFFEHGNKGHRNTLYAELLNVPLIVKLPGARWSGRRDERLVGIVDIAPTVLDVAGLPPLVESNGRNLIELLDQEGPPAPRLYFGDVDRRVKSVSSQNAKLIAHWKREPDEELRVELYDTARDPGEHLDLSRDNVDQVVDLRRALQTWVRAARELAKHLGESGYEQDPEMVRALRSLGYIR